jgi:Xaa-Pro aminopeptidase
MNLKEFARRRRQFMRMIGKNAIAILPAAPVRHRNGDIEYAYRQDSHFHYLSGFPEPDAVVVLVPGRPQAEYLLFVREHDALRESWDGARAGTEGAVKRYGADDAFPIADIDEILPGLMEQRSQVYYSMGTHPEFDTHVLSWVNGLRAQARQVAGAPHEFVALRHVLDDMRLYKSRPEQASLRRAAQIATVICCCWTQAASTIITPRMSRVPSPSAADLRRRNGRSMTWCWRHSSPPSTRCGPETTGIIRTKPPFV